MVDVGVKTQQEDSATKLFEWLATFKGFHNKLQLKTADDAGRGLFASSQPISPGEPVLVIPAASLLNPLTLAKSPLNSIPAELFPAPSTTSTPPRRSSNGTPRLTTTQLLTLHLALTRDPKQRHKSEWQVFIDTLPEFRPLHPLTWVIPDADAPEDPFWPALESCLSESVRVKIGAVRRRYEADLKLLRRVLINEDPFKSQKMNDVISDETFLWAWLNVNTRTVSTPLGLAEPRATKWTVNNHSFVPLLDMINHSSLPGTECPKPEPMPSTTVSKRARGALRPGKQHLVPGKVDVVLFAPHRGLETGEQVLFLYGPHSNATLFAEYGFTEIDECVDSLTWPNDDIDVGPWVHALWESEGGTDAKREALEDADMWDHNKLAANSGEPCPSLGLMTTLCVLASPDEAVFHANNLHARNFSRPTKLAARRLLIRICESVLADAAECRDELRQVAPTAGADKDKKIALGVVRGLLREEEVITKSVLETIEGGSSIPGF